MTPRWTPFLGLAVWAGYAGAAPPDAGALLRDELQRERALSVPSLPRSGPSHAGKEAVESGPQVAVQGFRIVGLTSVPESEVQAFLAPQVGRSFSLVGLQRVAASLERWLKGRGLMLAVAYIPEQDILDGMVEIRVQEGQLEGIDIRRAPGTRLPEERLRNTVTAALPPGAMVLQERLERGMLLLNDLPATSARAVLVEAAQGAVTSGSVELDNSGNRDTGEQRLGGTLAFNDAWGWGDQWNLHGAAGEGNTSVSLAYARPLGSDGWKAGLSWIDARYRLCCDVAVLGLGASGEASALAGFVSYPWLRSRQANLSITGGWAGRRFVNRALGTITSDRRSDVLSLGMGGDLSDPEGQGSYWSYLLQWLSGRLDLDGWPADKAQDGATSRAGGRFNKFTWQGGRLHRLSTTSALYAGLSGQWADRNLDSSEKFSLGGPQGVRAYPVGEASGDAGWLLTLEWRREFSPAWRVALFVDHGEIRLHNAPWSGWNAATPGLGNAYALSGAGAMVVWSPEPAIRLVGTLATRLAQNPARDAAGHDSDNRPPSPRLWLQASMAF